MGTHPIFESDFDCLTDKNMAPKKFTDTVEVTREDQEKINKFSRLNQRLTDVDAAVSSRQKIVKDITDASEIVEELQITDDEAPVHFKIGEAFFYVVAITLVISSTVNKKC